MEGTEAAVLLLERGGPVMRMTVVMMNMKTRKHADCRVFIKREKTLSSCAFPHTDALVHLCACPLVERGFHCLPFGPGSQSYII